MQSGILHAEDKDYKTAYVIKHVKYLLNFLLVCNKLIFYRYSYFYETLEGYSSQDDPRAILALKYMLLCKIMLNLVSLAVGHQYLYTI